MRDDPKGKPLSTASIAGADPRVRTQEDPREPNDGRVPLLPSEALDELRNRWMRVQSQFVDEPRRAVEQADSLVAELMMRIAETFASERTELENQWGRNEQVDTEDLRLSLQRYRSFFERLLDV